MSTELLGGIVLILLLVFLLLGIRVSTVVGVLGLLGILYFIPFGAFQIKIGIASFERLNSYNAAAIPLFAMMAMIINHTGVGAKLYYAFYTLTGRITGGLAITTIVASALF